MLKKFHELSKTVRIVVLVIPFVNWVCEVILRWSFFLSKKDFDLVSLIVALFATFGFGFVLGWVDAIEEYLRDNLVCLN